MTLQSSYWLLTGPGPIEVKVTLHPEIGKVYQFTGSESGKDPVTIRAEDLDNKDELVTILTKIINYAIKN